MKQLDQETEKNTITSVTVWKGSIPLRRAYVLSFGTLFSFDTLLLEINDDGGRWGLGEVTFLPGYSDESMEEGQEIAKDIASQIIGLSLSEAEAFIHKKTVFSPFVRTLFSTALYTLFNPFENQVRFSLTCWVESDSSTEAIRQVEGALAKGFTTVKLKAGIRPVDEEIAHVNSILRQTGKNVRVRVDVNGGFDEKTALRFVRAVEHPGLEWVEQPLPKGDWRAYARLIAKSPVPILLDESIISIESIQRAFDIGAAGVKLKLVKAGSPAELDRWIRKAQDLRLKLLVGNGVQTDVGCLIEAVLCLASGYNGPGEMNGWLKMMNPVLRQRVNLEGNELVFAGGKIEKTDMLLSQPEWQTILRRTL